MNESYDRSVEDQDRTTGFGPTGMLDEDVRRPCDEPPTEREVSAMYEAWLEDALRCEAASRRLADAVPTPAQRIASGNALVLDVFCATLGNR